MPEQLRPLAEALAHRFRIEAEIGRGGWGIVYLAHDLERGERVALKVLRAELGVPRARERFEREIAIAHALTHPNIVPLLENGEVDGALYFVMPFVAGETLRDRLKRERQLRLEDALHIASQVSSALAYAHAQGVVHRDIKPANILLAGDSALVADFGIARAVHRAAEDWITSSGVQIGTPEYMSPEQAAGESELDGRSDLYSLAVVLYEMLAGAPPFHGSGALAILARHSQDTVPPLRTVRPLLSARLKQTITKALAKVPADRQSTVAEFAEELAKAASADEPGAARLVRRRPVASVAAAVAVLAAALLLVPQVRHAVFPGAPAGNAWILVADFDAPRDERSSGDAVRELVAAGLNQARSLRVVPPEQVMLARREASIPDTAVLGTALARELAFRSSVRMIVTGGIRRIGRDGYSVVLNAIDAESGESRFSRSTYATDRGDALVAGIGTLVGELRQYLGERREEVEATRPLMRARTPSFAAFRRYADAMTQMRAGAYDRSNLLLQDAVGLDSGFATAWAAMAMNYVTARRPDSAAWAFGKAAAHTDRFTDSELHRLRGDIAFNVEHDLESAVQWYQRYLLADSDNVGGHNNLGLYLAALGRDDEALQEFERAAAIDPLRSGPRQIQLMNIAAELVVVGHIDSARIVTRRLQGAPAQYLELMLLNAEDRWDSLATVAAGVRDAPDVERFVRLPAATHVAAATAARGDITNAERQLLGLASTSTGANARWFVHGLLTLNLALGRSPSWLLPLNVRRDTTLGGTLVQGEYAALRGDSAGALRALKVLNGREVEAGRVLGAGRAYLLALLEAGRNAWAKIPSLLAADARRGEHDPLSLDRISSFPVRWLVAQAWARTGEMDSATAVLETLVQPTSIPPAHFPLRGFVVPLAHRQLALWYAESDNAPLARRHWGRFHDAWTAPDSLGAVFLLDPPVAVVSPHPPRPAALAVGDHLLNPRGGT